MRELLLLLMFFCAFGRCTQKTERGKSVLNQEVSSNSPIEAESILLECKTIDIRQLFSDTTWLQAYTNIDKRDPKREIDKLWECALDDSCKIVLTLFKDSTFTDYSPCEWDISFSGYYTYVCDTLYCIYIDVTNHSDCLSVQSITAYVRKENILKYIHTIRNISNENLDIEQPATNLIFNMVNYP